MKIPLKNDVDSPTTSYHRNEFAPIIVLGMHRSGTSLVASILHRLGVFMGAWRDSHFESKFFQRINIAILNALGGNWEHPSIVESALDDQWLQDWLSAEIMRRLRGIGTAAYLGVKYARSRNLFNLGCAWGWKDPRNTILLPLWLRCFPNARIVHVLRHGVDVSASLVARCEQQREHVARLRKTRISQVVPAPISVPATIRCSTVSNAFSLWQEYARQGCQYVQQMKSDALEIHYEDLLLYPKATITELGRFSGVSDDESVLVQTSYDIDSARAFAYRNNGELREYAMKVSEELREFGYEEECGN